MTENRQRTGLIVGRFQPFHNGHLHLIQVALKRVDRLTIAIGSSNITDENNPLNFESRKKMLEKVIKHEGLENKISKIIPSPDVPDDKKWANELIRSAGHIDIVFGNNSWTNNCLKDLGHKVVEIPYLDRKENQGKIIRKKIKSGKSWKKNVPEYLTNDIEAITSPPTKSSFV